MMIDKSRRGTVKWILLVVILSVVITLELSNKLEFTSPTTADSARWTDAEIPGAKIGEAEASSSATHSRRNLQNDILSRPLFSSSRRSRSASPDMFPGELVGIVEVDGAKTVWLLDQEKVPHFLDQGETLDGWTVDEVEKFQISMKRGRDVEWLSLRKPKPHLVGEQAKGELVAAMFKKGPEWGSPEFKLLSENAKTLFLQASEERRQAEEFEKFAKEAERLR